MDAILQVAYALNRCADAYERQIEVMERMMLLRAGFVPADVSSPAEPPTSSNPEPAPINP